MLCGLANVTNSQFRRARVDLNIILTKSFHSYFHMDKRYTNFGQNGGEIRKIIEIGIDMYIYS